MLTRPLWQPDARVMMMTWGCGPMCKELLPSLEQHAIHLDSLAQQMRVLIAIQQRMLQLLDNATGLPLGDAYILDQANPVANTVYNGALIPQASIVRQLSVAQHGAAGIITVYLKAPAVLGDPRVAGTPSGAKVIWRGGVAVDSPISLNVRVRIPAGGQLAIATAGAAVTNLNLNAIIDQAEATATSQFYGQS